MVGEEGEARLRVDLPVSVGEAFSGANGASWPAPWTVVGGVALADLAGSLLVDHLQWADVLLERIIQDPGSVFYRVVATMAQEFLSDEVLRLPENAN